MQTNKRYNHYNSNTDKGAKKLKKTKKNIKPQTGWPRQTDREHKHCKLKVTTAHILTLCNLIKHHFNIADR